MSAELTRRRLLEGAVGLASLGAAGCARRQAATPAVSSRDRYDVIVVGGGLAGLAAAVELQRVGVRALLIEAQARLGGRVATTRRGTFVAERGAQFVNRDMSLVQQALQEAKVAVAPLEEERRSFWITSTGAVAAPSEVEWLPKDIVPALRARLAREGDLPLSAALDLVPPALKEATASSLLELVGRPLAEVSLAAVLRLDDTYRSTASEDAACVVGGLDRLVEGLLAKAQCNVWMSQPVQRVDWQPESVSVQTTTRVAFARAVILALPPPMAQRIHFAPTLPTDLALALRAFVPGDMFKVVLGFAATRWRRPEAFDAVSLVEPGVTLTSIPGDRVLLFIGADAARRVRAMPSPARTSWYQQVVAPFVGGQPRITELEEGDWVDHPWCGGGYNSWVRYGQPADAAVRLREAVGTVVFAGSELSPRFAGYMEGALESGRLAARKVHEGVLHAR